MLNFLESYRGKQITYEVSQEKLELIQLRKEIKKYKKKNNLDDKELEVHSEESDQEEENDEVEDLIAKAKEKAKNKGARSSVSAEAYGQFNQKQQFVPKVVKKNEEQIKRIQEKVLKSFIFNMLDEKELKICIDAMEEYTCKKGDTVIKQGDPGSVLYIIESGHYLCYKTFVSIENNILEKRRWSN